MALCSFWRFIWGRIITKYSTTNINTRGSRPSMVSWVEPPAAAWAYAGEMNTGNLQQVRFNEKRRRPGRAFRKTARANWSQQGIVCGAPSARRHGSGGLRSTLVGLAPLRHQRGPPAAGGRQIALLHMAKTLDLVGQLGDVQCQRMVAGVQLFEQFFHGTAVFANQRPLGASLFGAAEHIQRGAPQELQRCQQAESSEHVPAELLLHQLALLVGLGNQGRRQMHLE